MQLCSCESSALHTVVSRSPSTHSASLVMHVMYSLSSLWQSASLASWMSASVSSMHDSISGLLQWLQSHETLHDWGAESESTLSAWVAQAGKRRRRGSAAVRSVIGAGFQ